MNAFLDRFCNVHRLTAFQAAKRFATRTVRADEVVCWSIPLAKMKAPDFVPVEYADPLAQQAFENVYRNKLHLLRVPA